MRSVSRGRASWRCAVAIAVGLGVAWPWTSAVANDCKPSPIPSTTRYGVGLLAGRTNAQVYHVTGALERQVLPSLPAHPEDPHFVVNLGTNMLFGAVALPAAEDPADYDCSDHATMLDLDLYASNLALGMKSGRFTYFYGGSVTIASTARDGNVPARALYPIIAPIWGSITGGAGHIAVPKSFAEGVKSVYFDWVVGAGVDADVADIRVGYLRATKSLYTNLTQSRLHMYLGSAFREEFDGLAYLKTGFDRIGIPASVEVSQAVGVTTVYGRKLDIDIPQRFGLDAVSLQDDAHSRYTQWTWHLEQADVFGHFDAGVAVKLEPGVAMQEGWLAVHSVDYVGDRYVAVDGEPSTLDSGFGYSIGAGFVNVPDMWWYGIEGGAKLSFALEASYGVLRLALRRNDPEILALFPYAIDATNAYVGLMFK